MYILTGGAGFIGSVFLAALNANGINDVLIVDNLGKGEKWKNLLGKSYSDYLHKSELQSRLEAGRMPQGVKAVIHLGACSSTTETDAEYVMQNNFRYSCALAEWAEQQGCRFIYASSAATYGDGSKGFSDDPTQMPKLRPLNVYGYSKHAFDVWAERRGVLKKAVGLKFFNVYGPNEYHKADMTSVIFKAYQQIQTTGRMRLFRSHRPEYKDGEQKRDFISVKDCASAMMWFLNNESANGLYNLGTGQARTWNDLAAAIFAALNKRPSIEYIDMPATLREKYQYFTEAEVANLRRSGYTAEFTSLEEGVKDYIENYLNKPDPIL